MLKPNYTNNIINISNSILKHYNCPITYKTLKILDERLNKNFKHVVFIILDGLGINVLNKHLTNEDKLKQNLVYVIDSVFPPTTVAATNAILSGKPPFATGFLGWMQYNKHEQANEIVFLNEDYYNSKNKLNTSLRFDFLDYPNLNEQIKRKNKDINVNMLMPPFDKNNGYSSFDEQLNELLMITKGKQSFSYCYWTEPDETIHNYGINSSEVNLKVKELNKSYERFIKEINDDVLVIVSADHGFMDVIAINLFDYKDIVNTFSKNPSIEPRALTFFIKEDKKKEFKKLFKKYFKKDFLLLNKEELLNSELLGYGKKHYLLDSFIGNYIAIATSNKMFSLIEGPVFKAHHAGLTKEELEVPLILNK